MADPTDDRTDEVTPPPASVTPGRDRRRTAGRDRPHRPRSTWVVAGSSASSPATSSRRPRRWPVPPRPCSARRPKPPAPCSIRPAAARWPRSRPSWPANPSPSGFRTPFREDDGVLYLIDQRHLPDALVEYDCRSAGEVAFAIREMIVRGAPAIGQVAAIGLAMTAAKFADSRPYARRATIRGGANALRVSRPTAVNLAWAVDRLMARYDAVGDLSEDGDEIARVMREEADLIVFEATEDHGRLATFGYEALPPSVGDEPLRILTHCNTGPLACGQFGTALGVVQVAHNKERPIHVWVDETRPYLQGARLTAWELAQAGVPHTLIPDVAAGHLMARGEVDVILVGADRVAANGDTANKVGTYTLAVLAARHGIPFYVCAPTSSVDLETPGRRGHPDRGAQAGGGAVVPWGPDRPAGHRGPQPVVRCHPGRAHHRHRHRGRRHPRPVRGGSRGRGREFLGRHAEAAALFIRAAGHPAARSPPRRPPWPGSADGDRSRSGGGAGSWPGPRPTGRSCASTSRRTGCTPRTRSATSRSANSTAPAGAWPGKGTARSRSSSSTTGRRPSRCS